MGGATGAGFRAGAAGFGCSCTDEQAIATTANKNALIDPIK
jgi:hypothetical protein